MVYYGSMRPLLPSLLGLALAVFLARKASRERIFQDFCRWHDQNNQLPISSDLLVRIRQTYGEDLAEATLNTGNGGSLCDVFYKMSTVRHWFSNPLTLLQEEREKPVVA